MAKPKTCLVVSSRFEQDDHRSCSSTTFGIASTTDLNRSHQIAREPPPLWHTPCLPCQAAQMSANPFEPCRSAVIQREGRGFSPKRPTKLGRGAVPTGWTSPAKLDTWRGFRRKQNRCHHGEKNFPNVTLVLTSNRSFQCFFEQSQTDQADRM